MQSLPRRVLGTSLAAALTTGVVLPVAATAAAAATFVSDSVVISEVYGGGGNSGATWSNDFVELYNAGTEPVSVDGWSVQYFSAAGNLGNTTVLSGTIEPGSYYLVQGSAGAGGTQALPTPDATGSFAASASNGTFALVSNGERAALDGSDADVVDLVGYGSATYFSGTAAAPSLSNTTSDSRTQTTGDNAADFTRGEPTPQNSGSTGTTDPSPEPTPEPTTEPTPEPTPEPTIDPTAVTPIAQIQGTGTESPLVGQTVTTEGVVTAVYDTGGTNGFVIQTGGTGGALDLAGHTASEGIFVYGLDAAQTVDVGDSVRVTGRVSEYYGLTQISASAAQVTQLETALAPVEPVTLVAFPTDEAARESLESMLYLPNAGEFTVTDVYSTNRYGEIGLVQGDAPLRQPGDVMEPGAEATALYEAQESQLVLLDDGKNVNFTSSTGQQEPFSYISTEEPVRVGASVAFTEPVIVTYGFDQWRLNLTSPWESSATDGVAFENTRTEAPEPVGGDVTVGSFNVLNYFTTLGEDTAGCTPYTNIDGQGTNVRGGCLLRGAWDAESFERQTVKIVEAINATDTSVLGLTEIENSARLGEEPDEALAYLVSRLNADAGYEKWAYVPTADAMAAIGASAMDQDVITNAIIYQPAEVALGEVRILADDPAFDNARDPIGAVFTPVLSAEEAATTTAEPFFFVINHFKSKGSADAADADKVSDPVVGNAEASRLAQAEALAAWVAGVQEELGVEDVFLAGDFNAYSEERPLQVFYDLGYTNLAHTLDPESWSYTFDGRVGSLDHVLANASAYERVTGATHWMINSPEAVSLQYSRYRNNVTDVYRPDVYASSDHDPVLAGVRAGDAVAAPVLPTIQPWSTTCETFGFTVVDMPAGSLLQVTWLRDGQEQYTSTTTNPWYSGRQAGWSDAVARVVAQDGTELATIAVDAPAECDAPAAVEPAATALTADAPKGKVHRGETIEVTGVVTAADGSPLTDVTGTVAVSIQGETTTAPVAADGSFTVDALVPTGGYSGLQVVQVDYSGDEAHAASTTLRMIDIHKVPGHARPGFTGNGPLVNSGN